MVNDDATSVLTRPRRAWLAGLMSLLAGPVGQVYAGRLRRAVFLWGMGVLILLLVVFSSITIPTRHAAFTLLLILAYPIYLAVDAFFLARRNRDSPLKPYQRWWVYVLLFAIFYSGNLTTAAAVRAFIAEAFVIPNRTMYPTLQPGDRLLVDKFWYSSRKMKHNDIVVFRSSDANSPLWIMRVVGLPGDEIEVVDEEIRLNGQTLNDQHAYLDPDFTAIPELV